MTELTSVQRSEIMASLEEGNKIEAIKLYREATGSDLANAKHFIESLQQALNTGTVPPGDSANRTLSSDQSETIVQLLQDGKKIEAIKAYRAATGVGLRAAKESVEAIANERGIATGSGCGTSVLLLTLIIAACICWQLCP